MSKQDLYNSYLDKAKLNYQVNKTFFKTLAKRKPSDLDKMVEEFHNEVFDEIDCLECAKCCSGLGPRLTDNDIARLAKATRMKPAKLTETYLRIDEDKDFVFSSMPCPFLGSDNYCSVYDDRPKACREYPHIDRKRFYQLLDLTLKNTTVCPAVHLVVEKLKAHYK